MKVLILAKTHYGMRYFCVGGIVLQNRQYVRLLNPDGFYQYVDTPLNVGDIWDITFLPVPEARPPHVEDVLVLEQHFIGPAGPVGCILEDLGVHFWQGEPQVMYDGVLNWTDSGIGYINERTGIPYNSVGFWIPDRPLTRQVVTGKRSDGEEYRSIRYLYPENDGPRHLPYKGCEEAVAEIPPGTIVRVSLAKWWNTHGTTQERCALQLSGWYDLEDSLEEEDEEFWDELPF